MPEDIMLGSMGLDISAAQDAIQKITEAASRLADHFRETGANLGHHMFGNVEHHAEKMSEAIKHHARHAHKEIHNLAGATSHLNSSLSGSHSVAQGVASRFTTLALSAAAATAAVTATITALTAKAFSQGSKDQSVQVKLEAQVGDTNAAKALIADLQKFALRNSMFNRDDLVKDATALINLGTAAKDIPAIFAAVGDIAVGTDNKILDLAKAYVEASAKSSLFAKDLEAFQDKGVPVTQALAASMHKSTAQVLALAAAGKISGKDLSAAFAQMTAAGGRFHGAMDRQSRTTEGLMATIKKEIGAIWTELGKPVNDVIAIKLKADVDWAKTLHEWARRAGEMLAKAAQVGIAAFQELTFGDSIKALGASLAIAFKSSVNVLWAGLRATVSAFGTAFGEVVTSIINLFRNLPLALNVAKGLITAADAFGNRLMYVGNAFLADFLRGLAKVPGFGGALKPFVPVFGAASEIYRQRSESTKDSVSLLVPAIDALLAGIKSAASFTDSAGRIAASFKDTWSKTPGVFDTKSELDILKGLGARIAARITAIENDRLKNLGPVLKKDKHDEEDKEAKTRLPGGRFAQAVNALMGRSVHELILTEAQKQTAEAKKQTNELEKQTKRLDDIQSALEKPQPRTARPQALVPVFGN